MVIFPSLILIFIRVDRARVWKERQIYGDNALSQKGKRMPMISFRSYVDDYVASAIVKLGCIKWLFRKC